MPDLITAFAGSPVFAAAILERLIASKYSPALVLTQPDRPKGRGRKLAANPVKKLASNAGIPVAQPVNFKSEQALAELSSCQPDVLIVAAYGLILPPRVLSLPTYGCINVHASMLPRWRGAAPIERAIMAGDRETGVCIMAMEAGLDTGPVYASQQVPIVPGSPASELEATLVEAGSEQLLAVLKKFAAAKAGKADLPVATAQNDDLATYASKLTSADRAVNWQQSAEQIARQVIALADRLPVRVSINGCGVQLLDARYIEQTHLSVEHTVPGTLIDASKEGLTVQCETDLLQITSLKVERGKGKVLDPAAAVNGFKDLFHPGARFVSQ